MPADETTPETTNAEDAVIEEVDYKAEAEKWKALSRKHETESKRAKGRLSELEPKASELDALKAAGLSAEERIAALTSELESERSTAAALKAERLREKVCKEAGLTADDAAFIPMGDEESMKASAAAFAKRVEAAKPRTDFDGGARKTASTPKSFGEVIREQMISRR